jgi:hypothetical protein
MYLVGVHEPWPETASSARCRGLRSLDHGAPEPSRRHHRPPLAPLAAAGRALCYWIKVGLERREIPVDFGAYVRSSSPAVRVRRSIVIFRLGGFLRARPGNPAVYDDDSCFLSLQKKFASKTADGRPHVQRAN